MLLKDLDYALSLKIGDPTPENGDGQIFTKDRRIGYLERGYARMIRILPKIMKEFCPQFARIKTNYSVIFDKLAEDGKSHYQGYTDAEMKSAKEGTSIVLKYKGELVPYQKIHQLRITTKKKLAPTSTITAFATYVDPESYLSGKFGNKDMYKPTPQTPYWTLLSNSIFLLPLYYNAQKSTPIPGEVETFYFEDYEYNAIELVFTDDAPQFKDADLKDNIPVNGSYVDLLVGIAAYEAMQDIARIDKTNLYKGDINDQLTILGGFAQEGKSKEGVETSE